MSETLTQKLYQNMELPVIAAPMFIVSNPNLLIQQCLHGIIGSMPALNARPPELLDEWLAYITQTLDQERKKDPSKKIAPFAINQIVHPSNTRLEHDLGLCAKYKVPLIITSLSAPNEVAQAVHQWGGQVFHDVISVRHAEKALEAGADGLILVATGAGGHAGTLSPFALLAEVRKFFSGPIALSGCISSGQDILAARAMGADFAYMGTRFIACHEANASQEYKQSIVNSSAKDILYTPYFTGVAGNYLVSSVIAAGLDPKSLSNSSDASKLGEALGKKAWKDIWGAGQGVGSIDSILSCEALISQLKNEYHQSKQQLAQAF